MQRGTKKENLFAKAFGDVGAGADDDTDDMLRSSNASHSCPFEYGYVEQPGDPGADNWTQVKKSKANKKPTSDAEQPQTSTASMEHQVSKTSAPELKIYNQIAYDRIVDLLQNKTKLMIIMRGAMGSGKSTLAKLVGPPWSSSPTWSLTNVPKVTCSTRREFEAF